MSKKDTKKPPARTTDTVKSGGSYSAKDIQVLEGLEPVRKRPGMYIGSTGVEGLHHLIWEVFDNSLDEAMAGHAKNIEVALLPDNKVRVIDDGRGIPTDIHPKTKKSALETAATTLHAGGKFSGESYKVSGGLHGVGLSVVNALSSWMRVEVSRKPDLFAQEYKIGKPLGPVKKIGKASATGTSVIFQPDPDIFKEIKFDLHAILDHLRKQAYLTKGIKIKVIDGREPIVMGEGKDKKETSSEYTFYFEGGITSYVRFLNQNYEPKNQSVFYAAKDYNGIFVEIALQYVEDLQNREIGFANNVHTIEGGMHVTGFRSAITRTLNDYARKNSYIKEKDDNLTGEDIREGLTVIISVKIKSVDLQFEGQTKGKLGNPEARTAVESVINTEFADWLERNPSEARSILEKVLLASKARLAAKAARETVLRKGALDGMTLPGKLADCSSKDPSESELFIVEGDSAGGCFFGDTKVALIDGRNLSFKELVEETKKGIQNYCYTVKENGHLGVAPILNPRITKKNTEVLKIVLDNREEIICTPDHKFMLRSGYYKEAKDLTDSDSLMPLYRKISEMGRGITIKGYEMIFNPVENYWRFTHVLSDKYNLENGVYSINDGDQRHHKDFNKLNNNPDNLVRMKKEDHIIYHTKHLKETAFRPEILEKLRKIRQSKEYRDKISNTMLKPEMRAMLSERAKKQWSNESYKKYMAGKFLDFYNSHLEYQQINNALLNKVQKEYWANEENRKAQSRRTTTYFEKHPENKELLSPLSISQCKNQELLLWRSSVTKKQWTAEFREKRKEAYNKTYLNHTIGFLKKLLETGQTLDSYNRARIESKNKNLLTIGTLCERFFDGNRDKMMDTVRNYNHKAIKIEKLNSRIDVYDIEVPDTHNFALASGIFVHNSSKGARDRRTQAILPLRGKILNVEKARLDKMLASEQIRNLIIAMGAAIAEEFDITKLRYHKIVIMTDADVDGAHIRTLLLTLFYRYFPKIIESGYLYVAQPPLYKIQKGSKAQYAYDDKEKDKILDEFRKESGIVGKGKDKNKKDVKEKEKRGDSVSQADGWEVTSLGESGEVEENLAEELSLAKTSEGEAKIHGVSLQRYKGLGEMNPDQLWETTLNPANRVLLQVGVEDAQAADKIFDVLMGSEVMPRRKFIQTHAKSVQNIDI